MKNTLILSVFVVTAFVIFPNAKANACIKALGFLDPVCVIQGQVSLPGLPSINSSNNAPQVVNNTTTNSNNVNSNINSPSTVNTNTNTNTPSQIAYIPAPVYSTYPTYSQLGVSCYSTPTSGNIGDTIRWGASPYGGNGNYYITWSGNDGLNGYGTSISYSYYSAGSKYASVTVTSGNQSITQNCNNVEIYGNNYNNNYNYSYPYNYNNNYNYNYNSPLTVSCSANVTFAPVETNVIWNANVSGGNGSYSYNWSGTDYLSGSVRSLGAVYHVPGTKSASVTVYSNNQTITQTCSNSVLVGAPNYYGNNYNNTYVAPAPIVKYIAQPKEVKKDIIKDNTKNTDDNSLSVASLFSLKNVPWGWVAVLVILVLFSMVVYLIFNRNKI